MDSKIDFLTYLILKTTINGDLYYKFLQEILYNFGEKVEDRDLKVGKKI